MNVLSKHQLFASLVSDCADSIEAGSREMDIQSTMRTDIISIVELNMLEILEELDSKEMQSTPVTHHLNSSLDILDLKEEINRSKQQLMKICKNLVSSNIIFNTFSINKYVLSQKTSTVGRNYIKFGDCGFESIAPESAPAILLAFSSIVDESVKSSKISTARKPTNLENYDIHIRANKTLSISHTNRRSPIMKQNSGSVSATSRKAHYRSPQKKRGKDFQQFLFAEASNKPLISNEHRETISFWGNFLDTL